MPQGGCRHVGASTRPPPRSLVVDPSLGRIHDRDSSGRPRGDRRDAHRRRHRRRCRRTARARRSLHERPSRGHRRCAAEHRLGRRHRGGRGRSRDHGPHRPAALRLGDRAGHRGGAGPAHPLGLLHSSGHRRHRSEFGGRRRDLSRRDHQLARCRRRRSQDPAGASRGRRQHADGAARLDAGLEEPHPVAAIEDGADHPGRDRDRAHGRRHDRLRAVHADARTRHHRLEGRRTTSLRARLPERRGRLLHLQARAPDRRIRFTGSEAAARIIAGFGGQPLANRSVP